MFCFVILLFVKQGQIIHKTAHIGLNVYPGKTIYIYNVQYMCDIKQPILFMHDEKTRNLSSQNIITTS